MARRMGNYFRGMVGAVYLKVVNGVEIMASNPKKIGRAKQTLPSVNSANSFGMASILGKYLRESLSSLVEKYRDLEMHNRITTVLNACLIACRDVESRLFTFDTDSFYLLRDIDFNLKSPLKKSLSVKPEIQLLAGKLLVAFPKEGPIAKLKFPRGYSNCQIVLSMSSFKLREGRYTGLPDVKKLNVQVGDDLNAQQFVFDTPANSLCVVSIFLNFFSVKGEFTNMLRTKDFSPSGILASIYTPAAAEEEEKNWDEMKTDLRSLIFE